jgi:hypothetical protein
MKRFIAELRCSSTTKHPTSLCRKSTPNTFQPPAKNRARTAEPTPAWDETKSSYIVRVEVSMPPATPATSTTLAEGGRPSGEACDGDSRLRMAAS